MTEEGQGLQTVQYRVSLCMFCARLPLVAQTNQHRLSSRTVLIPEQMRMSLKTYISQEHKETLIFLMEKGKIIKKKMCILKMY